MALLYNLRYWTACQKELEPALGLFFPCSLYHALNHAAFHFFVLNMLCGSLSALPHSRDVVRVPQRWCIAPLGKFTNLHLILRGSNTP